MTADTTVDVELPNGRTVTAGTLTWQTNAGGALIATTFTYTPGWISAPFAYALSPDVPLVSGPINLTGARVIPGALTDTGPDRWGRGLLTKAERESATREGRRMRTMHEGDFILGVDDRTRMSNVRLGMKPGGPYLSAPHRSVPTLVDLPRLVEAARRETAGAETDADIALLVAGGGTSMGGARPKVNVLIDGRLALAKLPAADDRWDVEAWEAACLTLAARAGLVVPPFELHRIDQDRSVLVLGRFDRSEHGRVGFISADTLTQKGPNEVLSYTDLVDSLGVVSAAPDRDRRELFGRVAFTLLVNNVDDHFKNHGVLAATSGGWLLSPLFDVNPWPSSWPVQSTPISPDGLTAGRSVEELVDAAKAFGLTKDEARAVIASIGTVTRGWESAALAQGIADPRFGVVGTAFDTDNQRIARAWARD